MIPRVFTRICGPDRAGKTLFIERVLRSNRSLHLNAARMEAFEDVGEGEAVTGEDGETDEMRRYREAGAQEAAHFRYDPEDPDGAGDLIWESRFMEKALWGILIEGVPPLRLDWRYTTFVMRPLEKGEELLERGAQRVPPDTVEDVARGMLDALGLGDDPELAAMARRIARGEGGGQRRGRKKTDTHWRLRDPYAHIADANQVFINAPSGTPRDRVERTEAAVRDLYEDEEKAEHILWLRRLRKKIHIHSGNLEERRDPGVQAATRRVREAIRRALKENQ